MMRLDSEEMQKIIDQSPPGRNTNFLKTSHNLWIRFQNYSKNQPFGLLKGGRVVAIIFATFNKNGYCNLYEIVTIQGEEGNGYASQIWDIFVQYAVEERGMSRLKMSCTPTSITWHNRNGLIYWAIDSSGSLRSDQPFFSTRKDQLIARELYLENPINALPDHKTCKFLLGENMKKYKFGEKKKAIVEGAIKNAGPNWLRDYLLKLENQDE